MKHRGVNFIFSAVFFWTVVLILSPGICSAQDEPVETMMPGVEAIGEPMTLPEEAVETTAEPPSSMSDEGQGKEGATVMSMLDIIKKGGIVGYLIILLSIIALGLIIDYTITIRKTKILPPKDIDAIKELIKNGNISEIENYDTETASFLTKISVAGLRESKLGYASMVKAMEDAAEALTSRIARKIEHLNVIGNISPMMGLLGTVIGMLRCFNEIAHVAGAIEPKQLAGGIFEALVTTCMGLIVAIPSLYGYAVFRNRIDEFTGEAALEAERLVSSYKSAPIRD